jgi:hypothetical protein
MNFYYHELADWKMEDHLVLKGPDFLETDLVEVYVTDGQLKTSGHFFGGEGV